MIVNTALTTDLHEKLKYRNIETYVKAFHSETVELDSKLSNAYKMSAIADTENFESENAYQSEVMALPMENEVVLPTVENAVLEQENGGVESVDQFGDFFDSTIVDVLGQSEEDSEDLVYDDEMEDEESSETSEYIEEEVQPVQENHWFIFDSVLTCQVEVADLLQNENSTEEGIILGDDEETYEDEEEPDEIIFGDEEEEIEEEESDDVTIEDDTEDIILEGETEDIILEGETEEEDTDNLMSDEEETIAETDEYSLLIISSLFEHQVTVNEETVEDVIEDETFEDEEEYSVEEEDYSEEEEEDIILGDGEEYSEEEEEVYSEEEEEYSDEEEEEEINLNEEEDYSEEEEEEISYEDEEEEEEIIMGDNSEDTENSFEDEDFIMDEEETVPTPVVPSVDIPVVPQVATPVVPSVDTPVVPQVTQPVVPQVVQPVVPQVVQPVVPPVDIPVVPQVTPIEQTQGSEETDSLFNLQDSDLNDDELLFSDTTQQEEVEVKPKEVPKKKKKKAPTKAEVPLKPKVADTKEIRAFIKERGSVTVEELFKYFDKKSISKAELSGKITKRNGKYKA